MYVYPRTYELRVIEPLDQFSLWLIPHDVRGESVLLVVRSIASDHHVNSYMRRAKGKSRGGIVRYFEFACLSFGAALVIEQRDHSKEDDEK